DNGTDNIKNDTKGTHLTISGSDKGILAAGEDINFGATGSLNQAGLFENVGSPASPKYDGGANAAAIDALFAHLTVLSDLDQILHKLLTLIVIDGNLGFSP